MDPVYNLVNKLGHHLALDLFSAGELSTEESEDLLVALGRNLWAAADVPCAGRMVWTYVWVNSHDLTVFPHWNHG